MGKYRDQALRVAIAHVQPDVDRGDTIQSISSSRHGTVANGNWVDIVSDYKVHVREVSGHKCDEYFSLRLIYKLCNTKQLTLF